MQISPNAHPGWLQRYLPNLSRKIRQDRERRSKVGGTLSLRAEIDRLAAQVEQLSAALEAVNNHVARPA